MAAGLDRDPLTAALGLCDQPGDLSSVGGAGDRIRKAVRDDPVPDSTLSQ